MAKRTTANEISRHRLQFNNKKEVPAMRAMQTMKPLPVKADTSEESSVGVADLSL
jgi:hypothetical protein